MFRKLIDNIKANPTIAKIIFFGSVAIFVASALESILAFIGRKFKEWFVQHEWRATLKFLTGEEKRFLKEYFEQDKAAIFADIHNGVATTLACKKILVRTSNIGAPGGMSFPFALQPWARKVLSRNRALLD